MKIVDQRPKLPTATTTIIKISVGQIFKGTIIFPQAGPMTGVWYKANGSWGNRLNGQYQEKDCVVVRIDESHLHYGKYANCCTDDRTVVDYEPLDVFLVIKG